MNNTKLWAEIFLFAGAVCNAGFGLYNLAHNQVVFGLVQIVFGITCASVFTLLLLRQE